MKPFGGRKAATCRTVRRPRCRVSPHKTIGSRLADTPCRCAQSQEVRHVFAFIRSIGKLVLIGASLAEPCRLAAENQSAPMAASAAGLHLADALQSAFLHNWDLLASKSDVDLATAQRLVAREFPNPSLALGTTKINAGNQNQPNSTASGNGLWERSYDTVVAVGQLIEIGGKRSSRAAAASAGWRGAEARLADARRLLEQAVTQAYTTTTLAERNQQVLANSAASLRREAKIAAIRERTGDISLADKSQIEMAADRLELDARAAEASAHSTRVALEVLLGMKQPRGDLQLADSVEQLADQPDATILGATNANTFAIAANRPDVLAAEAARIKAEADLGLQRAMRVPDPTVFAQYEHQPPDQPNTVGFGLSFPLPLWNRNRGAIAAAQAMVDQAAAEAQKVGAQAVADIITAQIAFNNARMRWEQYRDELAPKSQKIRETVVFAYENGGASLLDLLSAQRNDNEVRLATAQAAADSANATAALRAALDTARTAHSQKP